MIVPERQHRHGSTRQEDLPRRAIMRPRQLHCCRESHRIKIMAFETQARRAAHQRVAPVASHYQQRRYTAASEIKHRGARPERHRLDPRPVEQIDPRLGLARGVQHIRKSVSWDHVSQRRLGAVLGNERDTANPPLGLDLHHRLCMIPKPVVEAQRPEDTPTTIRHEVRARICTPFPRRRCGIGYPCGKPFPRQRQRQGQPDRSAARNGNVTGQGVGGLAHPAHIDPARGKEKGAQPLGRAPILHPSPDRRAGSAGTGGGAVLGLMMVGRFTMFVEIKAFFLDLFLYTTAGHQLDDEPDDR